MSKSINCLLLLMVLTVSTGCETLNGASAGFGQDVKNVSDPAKNGWDTIEQVDDWIQTNLW